MYQIIFLLFLTNNLFAADSELKIKDLKNSEISSVDTNTLNANLTAEQLAKLQQDLETLKENQKKSAEILKELDEAK